MLAALVIVAVMIFAFAAVASTVLAAVLWLVLLPLRLVFFLLKLVGVVVAGAVGTALFVVFAAVGLIVFTLAVFAPLLPFLLVAAGIWFLVRSSRRPVSA